MEKIIFIVLLAIIFQVNFVSADDICPLIYDFINNSYNSGKINYSTDNIVELTDQINNVYDWSISSETIIDYIKNYDSKCNHYKELPLSIQIGFLNIKDEEIQEKSIWEKYKYEIIFVTLIILGIFSFEYLK